MTTPRWDQESLDLLNYLQDETPCSEQARKTARYALLDALGCGILALGFPECRALLGPWPGAQATENGVPVPGTDFQLDPIKAAFDISATIRWLDYNDTWLAAEWGHPSDNLGGLLSVMDHLSRQGKRMFYVADLLEAMVKAYEIQGIYALENAFNRVGLDHVVLVKLATAALSAKLMGLSEPEILNTLSLVWVDGQSLRTYRHAPNTGSRKSWAAGDATARGVQLAFMASRGAMGYPAALRAKQWGFYDASFGGKAFSFSRPFGSYVMENILFKLAFPAEFHGQTAVECALALSEKVRSRFDQIEVIKLYTQSAAVRIIDKQGPLHNPADRDHCLQYMVAVALAKGELTAHAYEDEFAKTNNLDLWRDKMQVIEDPEYSDAYLDPNFRAIPNRIEVYYRDGQMDREEIAYPIGHPKRRADGIPQLLEKFERHVRSHFSNPERFLTWAKDPTQLDKLTIPEFLDQWRKS